MEGYLSAIAEQFGISLTLLAILFVWIYVWKLIALWKAAREKQVAWFIVFALLNTMGILEILYIFVFNKLGIKEKSIEQVKTKAAKIKAKKVSKKRK